jgi:hypothetical protein
MYFDMIHVVKLSSSKKVKIFNINLNDQRIKISLQFANLIKYFKVICLHRFNDLAQCFTKFAPRTTSGPQILSQFNVLGFEEH